MTGYQRVCRFLLENGLEVLEYAAETPTVLAAAEQVGCSPAEIAKTVVLLVGGRPVAVAAAGDMKVSSSLLKQHLGRSGKVTLPQGGLVAELTGYPAGGVCPFLLPAELPLLLDRSLERFATIYPAAGSRNSAVPVPVERLAELTGGCWAEVCQPLAESAS